MRMAVEQHSSRFEIIGKLVQGNQLQLSRKQIFLYSLGAQKKMIGLMYLFSAKQKSIFPQLRGGKVVVKVATQ